MMATQRKEAKRVVHDLSDSAHNIWLAGLGALSRAGEEGNRFFQELVDKGRDVETRGKHQVEEAKQDVESSLKDAKNRVETTADDLWSKLDQRMADAMRRFGVPTRDEIKNLTRRVEELNTKVDHLRRTPAPAAPAAATAAPVDVERKVYHVSTHEQEGWKVEAEGAARATSVHATKQEAVSAARTLAQNQAPSRVVVHKQDGTFQTDYTYELEA